MKTRIATPLIVLAVGAIVLGAVVGPAYATSHDDAVGPECAAVAVTMAMAGFGVLSLVVAFYVQAVINVVGYWRLTRQPLHFRFDPEERAEDRVVACAMNLGLVERNPGRVHEAAVLTASAYIPEFVLRGGPTAFWRAASFSTWSRSSGCSSLIQRFTSDSHSSGV